MEQLKIFCERNLFDPDFTVDHPQDVFLNSWCEAYFHNGIENLGEHVTSLWLDLPLNFLGMPFFIGELTWKTFCKRFFGWDEQKYLLPINIIRAFFFGLFNLLFIIPRFILNIVKLATELVPLFLRVMVHGWINKLITLLSSSSGYHWFTKIFIALPLVILFPLYIVFKLAHIIGRAITSPHKNLYAAWQAGQELAGDGILGKIASGFFCLIGLALTTLAYLILFPIAIKLIMTYAPTVISSAVQTVLNFLAPLSSFGSALGTVTTPIFQFFGYYIGSPVINGLAGVIGWTVGPFVVLLDKVDEGLAKFSGWWRTSPPWFKNGESDIKLSGTLEDLGRKGKNAQDKVSKGISNLVKSASGYAADKGQSKVQNPPPIPQKSAATPTARFQSAAATHTDRLQSAVTHKVPPQLAATPATTQKHTPTLQSAGAVSKSLSQPQRQGGGRSVLRQYQPLPSRPKQEKLEINKSEININKIQVLGEGASGCVYRATYNRLDVAVKQVRKGKSKFEREHILMGWASSDSPHVVYLYGICVSERMIVMEFMEKGSLDKFLRKTPAPSWETCYQIGLDITMGMVCVHAAKMTHNDLKSPNVLIDRNNRAKITDFDMGKYKQNELTSTDIGPTDGRGGTMLWMAPELFKEGQKTTPQSDVYSYGYTLWELCSKKYPHDGIPLSQLADVVGNGKRDDIPGDTPPVMGSVISQCRDMDPWKRPNLDNDLTERLIQEFNSYNF